jgi:hypothetical protein
MSIKYFKLILQILVTIKLKAYRNIKEESSWLLLVLAQDCLYKGLNLYIYRIYRGRLLENLDSLYRIGLLYCLPISIVLIKLGQSNFCINIL